MANRNQATFAKRQRESAKRAKQAEKHAKRAARRAGETVADPDSTDTVEEAPAEESAPQVAGG